MTTDPVSRRAFIATAMGGVVPVAGAAAWRQEQDAAVAPLSQPRLAGQPRTRTTDYENDPFIIGVEKRLRCTCGCNLDIYTCRTTDFTCTYSPQLHRQVVALVEQERSADEILAAFVAEHGETILMAPPKAGFNWAAYLLPGVAITGVGALLAWVVVRRGGVPSAAEPTRGSLSASAGLSSDEAARLAAELDRLEG